MSEFKDNEMFKGILEKRNHVEELVADMWRRSVDHGLSFMEVDKLPDLEDIPQLIDVFRKAGLKEFIVTDTSDKLILALSVMTLCECKLTSMCVIYREYPDRSLLLPREPVYGVWFELPEIGESNE